ncbi:hypothetical protein ACLM5J_10430 [Nocardioides sp. Bht2]|uniref:hypothetical protein n=1 Tax=Nocardioides sp. Bht2 TaxID=3392297 RepID=UPI0039B60C65
MAQGRHKRETNARKMPSVATIAAPVASLATLATVGVGVLAASPQVAQQVGADASKPVAGAASVAATRGEQASRSTLRTEELSTSATFARKASRAGTRDAIDAAKTKLWATEDLNLWSASLGEGENLGEIKSGDEVLVTGRRANGRAEVVWKGKARWVNAEYLSADEPLSGTDGVCSNGASIASGVSPNVVKVFNAVCARFPQISTYGTLRNDGEHGQGLAVDIMVSGELGWQVAEYIRENRVALGVSYLIYSQKIWSVQRGGEGWRSMSNRGSVTANHYDHVHVTTY